jgi:xylulokinase
MRQVVESIGPDRVASVCLTAQLGTVFVGESGRPLLPATTWADNRAMSEADELAKRIGFDRFYTLTGRRVSPELPAAKVTRLNRLYPDLIENTFAILTLKDYMVFRLTGRTAVDETHACYSGLYNIITGDFEPEILAAVNVPRRLLPEVCSAFDIAGRVSKDAAAETGLLRGTPVVLGGPDGTTAVLGAGVVQPGEAASVVGTTDVLFVQIQEPVLDEKARLVLNRHVVPRCWLVGGPMSTTGGCLEWFLGELGRQVLHYGGPNMPSLDSLMEQAAQVPEGSDRLVFLPSLTGERVPGWSPKVRGVIVGLSPSHSLAHVARAILEGAAFGAKSVLEIIAELKTSISSMRLIGGGARSSLWARIRADICGVEVAIPENTEASSLGAAIMAAVASGAYESAREACEHMVRLSDRLVPDSTRWPEYERNYRAYRRLQRDLCGVFDELAN